MKSSSHMNYLALNQNIFNKAMQIGSGPQEGDSETPINTLNGLQVYLNGTHIMPEHGELDEGFPIGSMVHPSAMMGMPDCSGELNYDFWVTDKEYIIIVRLQLDESSIGESDPAVDILALVKRDTLPDGITDTEESYGLIAQEMIVGHFDSLFEFYERIEDLDDWTFNDDTLYSFVQYHFELKHVSDAIDKELK